jgi:hypothetical protein
MASIILALAAIDNDACGPGVATGWRVSSAGVERPACP